MSYKKVIKKTKKIETILVKMGAEGKGLHEKVSSVEHLIEVDTVKSIRFVASIRNKLLHEDNFEMTPELLSDFEYACENIIDSLKQYTDNSTHQNYNSESSSDSSSNWDDSSSNSSSWDNFSTGEKIGIGAVALGAFAVWSWFNA